MKLLTTDTEKLCYDDRLTGPLIVNKKILQQIFSNVIRRMT